VRTARLMGKQTERTEQTSFARKLFSPKGPSPVSFGVAKRTKRKAAPKIQLTKPEQWLVRAGLLLALGISVFLAWNSFHDGRVPGCGPESNCDKVLSSRWAYVFGLPASVFALPIYAALLVLLFRRNLNWKAALPLALTILGAALWFSALQAFALRAFCKFCMTAHIAGGVAAVVLLRNAPLPGKAILQSLLIAMTGLIALVGAQFATPPRAPSIVRMAHSEALVRSPGKDPTFTIVEGQFTLNLSKLPVTGPLTAPKKLVKLFDYSCHHCRNLHLLLEPFRREHSNELAVISLPVPLCHDCNPLVKRTPPDHVNACEYARLGLAVFFANPAKFDEFTDWVFAPPRPPPVSDTQNYAERLVGSRELRDALNSPAVGEQIATDINIYATSSRLAHSSQLPQMLFEQEGGSIGAVQSADQLKEILAQNLGIGAKPQAAATNSPPK
jgi:uncharacterized membrane protein